MSFYAIEKHESEQLLSLTKLPNYTSFMGKPFQIRKKQVYTQVQEVPVFTGERLVAFGDHLNPDILYQLLNCLAEIVSDEVISCAVSQYSPDDRLSAALVITGLPELATTSINQIAMSLSIELALVSGPTISKPGILVLDMDSTAIQIECIDKIAECVGIGEKVADITIRTMRGELDFAQSLRQRVQVLKGTKVAVLEEILADLPLMPGLEHLVSFLRDKGWLVAIASGGFTYFTVYLQQKLQLIATLANQLEIIDGELTGNIQGTVVDAQAKADFIMELANQYQVDIKQTMAIGDGANDLLMLAQAQLGVAFHAKPLVKEQAHVAVNQGALDQALYLLLPTVVTA